MNIRMARSTMVGQGQLHSISPRSRAGAILLALALFAGGGALQAQIYIPGLPDAYTNSVLDAWSFNDTSYWTSDLGYAPLSFTNLSYNYCGAYLDLVLDSTNAAWLQYNLVENDGTTNLNLAQGTVTFWFAADWSSTNQGGTGPGVWGRLLEVGTYTTNASFGWWSLYLDDVGGNIYFSAQSNDSSQATYLSAPIGWLTNDWHFIALTYSATNSALYLDGTLLTNGPPVSVLPGSDALTNGFYIGSDSSGVLQAHGMLDDVVTYNVPLDAYAISRILQCSEFNYWCNPYNRPQAAPGASAPSSNSYGPAVTAISGIGFLQSLGSAGVSITSSNVWMTNIVWSRGPNQSGNLKFDIQGGYDNLLYDVFANASLTPSSTAYQWAWMGQGLHGNTYQVTNLPFASSFLILGTPQDSDFDGYTDAYEFLVGHTSAFDSNLSGDGLSDLYKVQHGLTLGGVVAVPALSSISLPTCAVP